MKRLFFGNGKHKSTKNKISAISPNFNSIFRQFSETLISFGKTILFGKSPGFRQIVSVISQSPYSQPYPKTKKEEPTSHSGEPLYAQNPLISSHFSILLPNRTQIPMASIINSRLCRCESLMTFTPGVKMFTPFTPPNSTFDKRDSTENLCFFAESAIK